MITSCVHWQEAKKGEREENVRQNQASSGTKKSITQGEI